MGMAEYIEREKIGLTDFEIAMCNGNYKEAFKMLLEKIESIQAADVRPVVRGKWERTSKSLYACSECGNCVVDERIAGMFYCPNCGADMRGEQDV